MLVLGLLVVAHAASLQVAAAMPQQHSNSSVGAERICKWYGIGEGEYCCPDAKHCLRPVKGKMCGHQKPCGSGETCCPLTKLCVTVHAACTPPMNCPNTSYCCPDAHTCMKPTNPGNICKNKAECGHDEICCPTSHLCVKVGGRCTPPVEVKPSWMTATAVDAPEQGAVADHSTVYIIRHGEKTWSGGCLNPPGQERANHLPAIFNGKPSAKHATFATPTALFADQYLDGVDCERCWSTIEPTAQFLNMSLRFDHGHKMNGGNAAAAAAIKAASKTNPVILVGVSAHFLVRLFATVVSLTRTICVQWEHVNIQYLTADLGVNPSAIPKWKGTDYDTVYVLKLSDSGSLNSFKVEAQNYKPCSTSSTYKPCKPDFWA